MSGKRLFVTLLVFVVIGFGAGVFAQEEQEDYSVRDWNYRELGEKEQERRPEFNYLEEKLPDLRLNRFQFTAGGGVGAQDLVVQFALEPEPAAVLVDRGLVDPARGADL